MSGILVRFLCAILFAVLPLVPVTASAEKVIIPVFLNYPQLQNLMKLTMFTGPGNAAVFAIDSDGCNTASFFKPRLSAQGDALRLTADTLAVIGVNTTGSCLPLTRWSGRADVLGKPSLADNLPLSVQFQVRQFDLYDPQGRLLSDSLLPPAYKAQLHQVLGRLRMDLKPATDRLKALLPYVVSRQSAAGLNRMIDSLRIGHVEVRPHGLDIHLVLDAEKPPPSESEPALTALEVRQLEQRCRDWDAFLTFVIKEMAAATRSEALRSTLLEILLDIRYELKDILTSDPQGGSDPVKRLFIESWERLEPVMREISLQSSEHYLLPFMSFVTAADALKALDRLGPSAGLDISTDGLRRLARLLNENPDIDPLNYSIEIDPGLQRLFDIGIPADTALPEKRSGFSLWPVRPAYAATRRERLNSWVPTSGELDTYLQEIRDLLLQTADKRLQSSNLDADHARVFRNLMLAAAWQESCWRQYVVEKRKIVPLVSASGDIGMLQINEKVWRGFYAPDKLRWDIIYNVRAGSEILFKFMTNYALKQQEHKRDGGLANLARASYSAYNGGPAQVSRYRRKDVPAAYRKIDTLFWTKYQQISRGAEFAVAQCLGGQDPGPVATAPGKDRVESKPVTPAAKSAATSLRIETGKWIKQRNPKHFTLQLAAVSSEQAVRDLIGKYSRPGDFAYYRKKQQGQQLYVALYGSFSNRTDAEKAASRFAPLKPWIRDFGSVQSSMSKP